MKPRVLQLMHMVMDMLEASLIILLISLMHLVFFFGKVSALLRRGLFMMLTLVVHTLHLGLTVVLRSDFALPFLTEMSLA